MILASNSAQRKKLIKMLFEKFENLTVETDEKIDEKFSIYENLKNIAFEKAEAVVKSYDIIDDYVLGVDTVVYFNSNVLLKPENYDDAFKMIKSYENESQEVISGIALLKVINNKIVDKKVDYVISKVRFNDLSDNKVKNWLDQGFYKYCSGGFMIEKIEEDFKMEIEGSYSNIIGLPLNELKDFCNEFGIKTLNTDINDITEIKKYM